MYHDKEGAVQLGPTKVRLDKDQDKGPRDGRAEAEPPRLHDTGWPRRRGTRPEATRPGIKEARRLRGERGNFF
jgi:hypothetical protein